MRTMIPALLLSLAAAPLLAAPAKDYSALKSPAEIYAAYQEARRVAPAALKAIEADKPLYDALNTAENRKDKAVMRSLIEKSTAAASASVQTLLLNLDDFTIDSYEGGLVFDVDFRRWLDRLEAKGVSAESWKLRMDYLKAYSRVDMPWCEGLCEGPSFDSLVGAITESRSVYAKKPYSLRLAAWVSAVADRFERELSRRRRELASTKDEEARRAFEDQAREVRERIALLREFAKKPGGSARP